MEWEQTAANEMNPAYIARHCHIYIDPFTNGNNKLNFIFTLEMKSKWKKKQQRNREEEACMAIEGKKIQNK